ncbi:MAG: AmmeMemoRadiSam system protein A [Candidatus Coatesbacteria bacterium]|nr:MAG: AmmeMemoRadiSam system protein A [Candidatus Coatesbacteria bacterium]
MKRRILTAAVIAGVLVVAGGACRRKEPVEVSVPESYPPREEERPATTAEEKELLALARETLRLAVEEGRTYEPPPPALPELHEERGVFVTLKEGGRLRGCIGYVLPTKPLYLAVRDMAINSALRDPRFPPVTAAELPALYVEISVMTPLQPVADPNEIVVGEDGLVIEGQGRTGLLLPQVAPEQGWTREQFLEGVCMKAGLPPDAYTREDVKLQKFQAHIFGGPYVEPPA